VNKLAAKKKIKKREHPSLDIVSSYGVELSGKRIVLCVAGSVAAYKAIELARLLMRHGADVTCVTSNAATKLIQPDYFKWATGNEVITKLTGELEHIRLADYNQSDLIIVYPGTANTLGKLANGIDDTPISTVLTVGFGSKIPILMCLAMHDSMYGNLAVKKIYNF
jgi:phosphopantothenoylcysteine decarboxylase/phosphopantothenate--cysteine ligase